MVVRDGPLTTAGAAFGQGDLMLSLFRARFSTALAEAVSKFLLVDGRQAQSPYVVPSMLADGSALIRRLTQRIESALPHLPSIAALAREFAMSQRTLSRHVRSATGQGPSALVQSVRLNRAKMLIESSRMTIDEVAEHVGYQDATALRRLMRKITGANPSQFRRKL
jgi:transcriptional regulator GlxA family with amidase domain